MPNREYLMTPNSIMTANKSLYQAAHSYIKNKDNMTPANALALSKILVHQAKMCELYLIENKLSQIEDTMRTSLEIEKQKTRFKAIPFSSSNNSIQEAKILVDLSEAEW